MAHILEHLAFNATQVGVGVCVVVIMRGVDVGGGQKVL